MLKNQLDTKYPPIVHHNHCGCRCLDGNGDPFVSFDSVVVVSASIDAAGDEANLRLYHFVENGCGRGIKLSMANPIATHDRCPNSTDKERCIAIVIG